MIELLSFGATTTFVVLFCLVKSVWTIGAVVHRRRPPRMQARQAVPARMARTEACLADLEARLAEPSSS